MAIIKSSNSTDELIVDPTSKAARTTNYTSLGEEVKLYSDLVVTTISTANASVTLTLPAPATGYYHYITSIDVTRVNDSAVDVAGTALLTHTTTNLPGSLAYSTGNLIAAGSRITDVRIDFKFPLKSSVAATATTIVAPAAGANVKTRITVIYYIGL